MITERKVSHFNNWKGWLYDCRIELLLKVQRTANITAHHLKLDIYQRNYMECARDWSESQIYCWFLHKTWIEIVILSDLKVQTRQSQYVWVWSLTVPNISTWNLKVICCNNLRLLIWQQTKLKYLYIRTDLNLTSSILVQITSYLNSLTFKWNSIV